jgi:hypothetical protein
MAAVTKLTRDGRDRCRGSACAVQTLGGLEVCDRLAEITVSQGENEFKDLVG